VISITVNSSGVIVGTVTDDIRLYEVPALKVVALRFTETARARISADFIVPRFIVVLRILRRTNIFRFCCKTETKFVCIMNCFQLRLKPLGRFWLLVELNGISNLRYVLPQRLSTESWSRIFFDKCG
jgi:hypothetical protein